MRCARRTAIRCRRARRGATRAGPGVRNGCRKVAGERGSRRRALSGLRTCTPTPACPAAKGRNAGGFRLLGGLRREIDACRGTPTARGRGGAGTPSRTGRAGGSRRGGRPRGRSGRGGAGAAPARSIRTAVRCSRNVVLPDLGVRALKLTSRGRDATSDVVERQVGAVLGLDDGVRHHEEARAVADRGGSSERRFPWSLIRPGLPGGMSDCVPQLDATHGASATRRSSDADTVEGAPQRSRKPVRRLVVVVVGGQRVDVATRVARSSGRWSRRSRRAR